MPDLRNDVSKRKVGRTKIVSPLADAVRLVDHEERYANRLEDVEKALVFELLGRRVQNLYGSAGDAGARGGFLVLR